MSRFKVGFIFIGNSKTKQNKQNNKTVPGPGRICEPWLKWILQKKGARGKIWSDTRHEIHFPLKPPPKPTSSKMQMHSSSVHAMKHCPWNTEWQRELWVIVLSKCKAAVWWDTVLFTQSKTYRTKWHTRQAPASQSGLVIIFCRKENTGIIKNK